MSRFNDQNPITGNDSLEERVKRLEEQQASWGNRFFNTFTIGRLRTDRTTAPASSADVNATDRLYDIIRVYPYEYVLINNSGAFNWVRISMSTF
jgi:hypothetical protein